MKKGEGRKEEGRKWSHWNVPFHCKSRPNSNLGPLLNFCFKKYRVQFHPSSDDEDIARDISILNATGSTNLSQSEYKNENRQRLMMWGPSPYQGLRVRHWALQIFASMEEVKIWGVMTDADSALRDLRGDCRVKPKIPEWPSRTKILNKSKTMLG